MAEKKQKSVWRSGWRGLQQGGFSAVSCCAEVSYLLTEEGDLYSSGRPDHGVLGRPESGEGKPLPEVEGEEVIGLALGWGTAYVLCASGALFTAGYNSYGQCLVSKGKSTSMLRRVDVEHHFGVGVKVIALAAGNCHVMLLVEKEDASQQVWMAGSNPYGQLGVHGTTVTGPVQPELTPSLANQLQVKQIALGGDHTVLCANGKLFTWGYNSEGQLAVGGTANHSIPKAVPDVDGNEVAWLAAGNNHTCVAFTDGSVKVCGANSQGQLGIGTTTSISTLQVVTEQLEGKIVTMISCGRESTHWLTADGELYSAGRNRDGELGVGQEPSTSNVPMFVTAFYGMTVDWVNAHNYHCLASAQGILYSWGREHNNRLCNEAFGTAFSPMKVTQPPDAKFLNPYHFNNSGEEWSTSTHKRFPFVVRQTIVMLLMLHRRGDNVVSTLPKDLVLYMFALAVRRCGKHSTHK